MILLHLLRVLPFLFGGHRQLALENLALRHELAVYKRTMTRPRLRRTEPLLDRTVARSGPGGCSPYRPPPTRPRVFDLWDESRMLLSESDEVWAKDNSGPRESFAAAITCKRFKQSGGGCCCKK